MAKFCQIDKILTNRVNKKFHKFSNFLILPEKNLKKVKNFTILFDFMPRFSKIL